MDEMNGAFEEKKRRKGGKRLMQPEKAAKVPKVPRAENRRAFHVKHRERPARSSASSRVCSWWRTWALARGRRPAIKFIPT